MKVLSHFRTPVIQMGLLFVCSMALGGCSETAQKEGFASGAMKDFQTSLVRMEATVDTSIRTLDRLSSAKTFSKHDAYMDFLSDYFNVGGQAAEVGQRAEVMRDAGVDYFLTAATSPDATPKAKRVADAVRPKYDKVQESLMVGRDAFKAYQKELATLVKYLSKDESPERIASAADLIASARQKGTELKAAIQQVRADTDQMGAAAKAAAEG